MELNTFFQVCVAITVGMFLFMLSLQYVSNLGIYDISGTDIGVVGGGTSPDKFENVTQGAPGEFVGGIKMDTLWTIVLTGAGIAGLAIAWITHSTAIIGVFLFSAAFWTSYHNMVTMINPGNFIDPNFIMIGTAAMFFVWIGAVAGMLSGSG